MDIKAQRTEILQQVESGEMTPEEAARWLAALDKIKANGKGADHDLDLNPGITPDPKESITKVALAGNLTEAVPHPEMVAEPQPVTNIPHPVEPTLTGSDELRSSNWQGWWLLVFVPGLLLAVAAVSWMNSAFLAAGLSWGFWLSLFPFTLGVVLMWLGWEIRSARWLHLRVQQKRGSYPRVIALNFPLPLGLLSWGIRRFGHFTSSIHGKDVGDLLTEIDQAVTTDGLMHIEVNDPDGDRVEIWIDGPKGQ